MLRRETLVFKSCLKTVSSTSSYSWMLDLIVPSCFSTSCICRRLSDFLKRCNCNSIFSIGAMSKFLSHDAAFCWISFENKDQPFVCDPVLDWEMSERVESKMKRLSCWISLIRFIKWYASERYHLPLPNCSSHLLSSALCSICKSFYSRAFWSSCMSRLT